MPSFRKPRLPNPGEQVSSRELRKFMEEVSRVLNLKAIPPLFVRSGTTFDIGIDENPFFPALITGGSNPYSWIEQIERPGGGYNDKPFGLRGSPGNLPAYEMNDKEDVPYGQIVWMRKAALNVADGQEYQFWGEDEFPYGYYGNRQGKYCIDIEKQKCVDGVLIDDSISIHSNVPIWMSRDRCDNPTGQGGDPSANPACPLGQVDTAAYTPCDCSPQVWAFNLSGILPGTCTDAHTVLNTAWVLVYQGDGTWTYMGGATLTGVGCGDVDVDLYYAGGYWYVSFSVGAHQARYRLNGLSWNCLGPNTMTLVTPKDPGWANNWPDTIFLED